MTTFGRCQPFLRGVFVVFVRTAAAVVALDPLLASALFFLGCSALADDEMAAAAAVAASRLRLDVKLGTTSLSPAVGPGVPTFSGVVAADVVIVLPPALTVDLFVCCDFVVVPVVFAAVAFRCLGVDRTAASTAEGSFGLSTAEGCSFGGRGCPAADPAASVRRRRLDSSLVALQPPFLRLSLKVTLNREPSEGSTSTTAASRAGLPGVLAMTGSPTRSMMSPPSLVEKSGAG